MCGKEELSESMIAHADIVEEELAEERSSRRKCSKAATAKISQFAKQLRSTNWDGLYKPPIAFNSQLAFLT